MKQHNSLEHANLSLRSAIANYSGNHPRHAWHSLIWDEKAILSHLLNELDQSLGRLACCRKPIPDSDIYFFCRGQFRSINCAEQADQAEAEENRHITRWPAPLESTMSRKALAEIIEPRQAHRKLAATEAWLHVALDNMPGALVYTDNNLNIIICNQRFKEMYRAPSELLQSGRPYPDFLRFLAENGYYGKGDIDQLVAKRVESLRNPSNNTFEDRTPDGRTYRIHRRLVAGGGVVTVMTDITELKKAELELVEKEAQFHAALDNMPGALVYTNENLNIEFCNQRFKEMYQAPDELLQSGRPYPDFLRFLAENGYYGQGDVEALVAKRVESLRNPSGKTFEDHAPNGRVYRIRRRPVQAGGVVTVMTDITEEKKAEIDLLEAKQRTEEANALVTEKNQMLEGLSRKLSKYLSPQVYRSIFSGNQNVEIASKRKKLTVFFSDIAAFTETTNNLESEELTDVLNHYLTEMSAIALEYGATIDKYIGDAMLLFFGDPETKGTREDAKACVMMAMAMQRRMQELEQEWRERGLERPFRIRMGISTGFCTVGNFGSSDRMDYTIIGNEVNLASRLESVAEPGSILLANETNALVHDIVLTEEQPPITVKGFSKPINTYKIVGSYDELVKSGRIVLQERDGLRVLVDLTKHDKAQAITILEEVLSQLRS
jgi:class 3 adenylate cyclase/PAS domain-containing protein